MCLCLCLYAYILAQYICSVKLKPIPTISPDKLHERFYDKEEKVRLEVVKAVCEAAADDFDSIPDMVCTCTKLRVQRNNIVTNFDWPPRPTKIKIGRLFFV